VRHHFIREKVEEGVVKLEKISTDENPSDMATKVISVGKFQKFLDLLSIGRT